MERDHSAAVTQLEHELKKNSALVYALPRFDHNLERMKEAVMLRAWDDAQNRQQELQL